MSLAPPAGDRGHAAAAAFKTRLSVVEVWGGGVHRLEAEAAALAAHVTGGGLHPGRVAGFGPRQGIAVVVCTTVRVLARTQGDLTLGY